MVTQPIASSRTYWCATMPRDIVIVPTFDRPEYLWVTLEYLLKADGIENKEIWLREDIHTDKPKSFTTEMEMLATIRYFEKQFPAFKYKAIEPHTTYGNSRNLIQALNDARQTDAPKVFIVEDDVLVTKDFLTWTDTVHEKFHPEVLCAGRLNRSLNFAMNGPDAMDESIKDSTMCKSVVGAYISWATCFSRTMLAFVVGNIFDSEWEFKPGVEQDMIIQDLMRHYHIESVWPFVPRAYHMGWYSYHRDGMKFYGTLEEKVTALRRAVTSKEKIRAMACLQEIDAFPTKQHEPATDLYLVKK